MPRPKMKRVPVPVQRLFEPLTNEMVDEIVEKIKTVWRGITPATDLPSEKEIGILALNLISFRAWPVDGAKVARDSEALKAMKTLLDWCEHDPDESGLPHLTFVDVRKANLANAIRASEHLIPPSISRPWQPAALQLWVMLNAVAEHRGEKAAINSGSHAIQFVSSMLEWVGWLNVTPGAVSMEIRRAKDRAP